MKTNSNLRLVYIVDSDDISMQNALVCKDKSLTHQSFKEECDINTIIDRFGISGELPEVIPHITNDDFVDVFDFHTAQNQIIEAQKAFLALPARVRSRFDNDAGAYVEFCSDPANVHEMVELGIAVVRKEDVKDDAAAPLAQSTT